MQYLHQIGQCRVKISFFQLDLKKWSEAENIFRKFPSKVEEGVNQMMENSIMFLLFFYFF